jgi:uncharacterized membrane protein
MKQQTRRHLKMTIIYLATGLLVGILPGILLGVILTNLFLGVAIGIALGVAMAANFDQERLYKEMTGLS